MQKQIHTFLQEDGKCLNGEYKGVIVRLKLFLVSLTKTGINI